MSGSELKPGVDDAWWSGDGGSRPSDDPGQIGRNPLRDDWRGPGSSQAWAADRPGALTATDNRPGRRRRWAVTVIAAVAVIVAATVVVLQRGGGGPSYPAAWDPRVAAIAGFVQTQRGLTWKHPVKVEFLAASKFNALMAKENAPDARSRQDGQTIFDTMRAMGVASGNVDLAQAAQQFAQADVVGQYVNSDRTVYVRGAELTPYVRSVLAHELTHALQAQYFNLDKMKSGHADDDQAVTALIEGDAVRVQNAYEQSLSASDQQLLAQEEQQGAAQAGGQNSHNGIPPFLVDQSEFPYDFGPTFVAALVAQGGNAQVDAAFRNPPTLDGQIIDPQTYLAGAGLPNVKVAPLPKGSRQLMAPSGFGQLALLEMLGDQLGFSPAWSAVQGWTGDQSVPYRQNGRVCLDLAVGDDTATAARSLLQTGKAWASRLSSASVSQSGTTVNFQTCDPGSGWKPSNHPADPYQDLAVRSVVMNQLITDGHLHLTTASCAVNKLMITMGPQNLLSAEQSASPNSPAVQELRVALINAVASCA